MGNTKFQHFLGRTEANKRFEEPVQAMLITRRTSLRRVFFPLALQPNLGLGRLHETFRFTSVTISKRVGRSPLTGDQLVVRPLSVHKHSETHTQHKH
jgi:hypothetical protein